MSEFLDDTDTPAEFLCSITQQIMVHPFTTAAGNSYEYEAIAQWLQRRNVDPLTNVALADATIFPNNSLRSSIQAWLQLNPAQAAEVRARRVAKPPPEAYAATRVPGGGPTTGAGLNKGKTAEETALSRVLRVQKCFELGGDGGKTSSAGPLKKPNVRILEQCRGTSINALGHTYTWESGGERVRCDGGAWVEAPEPDLFPTPLGLVFFDRTETLDARVLPGTDMAETCKFGNGCTKADCAYAHPFVCRYGTACRHLAAAATKKMGKPSATGVVCKFLHPSPSSVIPRGSEYPLTQECRYGTACSNATCHFAHPQGRLTVQRQPTRVMVTHTATLEELETPIEIPFDLDPACTAVQMQGEFLFSFEPYPGPWAKEHFRLVTVHKFDAAARRYRKVSTYELERHYCNCAVASGRYLIISFWPYEDETMRTVWECMRIGRTMEKALASNSTEIKSLRDEIDRLKQQLRDTEGELRQAQQDLRNAQGEADALRQQVHQLQRSVQQAQRVIASKNAEISQRNHQIRKQQADHSREVRGLSGQLSQARARESIARSKAAQARSDARAQRQKAEVLRRQYGRLQKAYEIQRKERWRLADPIHVYALRDGSSGFNRDDWTLVLDYHKGAHELSLSPPSLDGRASSPQVLEVLEHSTVVQFELCVPRDINAIGARLPLQPGRLCEHF